MTFTWAAAGEHGALGKPVRVSVFGQPRKIFMFLLFLMYLDERRPAVVPHEG
jgi:hypothetical protein